MCLDRWSEVEKLYHAALDREPHERTAFLDQCPDKEIRKEVQSLLEHQAEGDRLLDGSPWKTSLAPGTRLGAYEIQELIGYGGMGDVYRARDPRVGRDVAIKVSSERFSDRFSREAHAVAALNHPNICTLYDVGENYLVMEFVDGPTLAERISSRGMKREEALPIAKQIAEAVEYAHEKGIIHRDLKPANVKLTLEGRVKLLDFGLAKMLEGPLASSTESAEGTRTGIVMGTAAYMAPEQAQGKPVDRRADIWAFGVVLFEMFTGKQLYQGESSAEVLAAVIRDTPNLDALPENLRQIVGRCLRKDPRERWRHIGDVWIAIEEAPQTIPHPAEQRRPSRPKRALGFSSAGVLLAGMCALGFWLWQRSTPGKFSSPIPVTSGLGFVGSPSFSPDGKQIAYSSTTQDDPTSSIYVRLVGSQRELRVTAPPGADACPAWSPDGKWIAFLRAGIPSRGYYLVSALGGPVQQLLKLATTVRWPPVGAIEPGVSWFPDSRHVAVSVPPAIVSVDIETGEQQQLTDAKDAELDWDPAVSPDGKTLAFLRVRRAAGADIYLADLAGHTARPLTKVKTAIGGLTWTPDGRELVFGMERDGFSRLWRMAIHGGDAQLITPFGYDLWYPAIARQGNRLAYVESSGRTNLWRTDVSASDPPTASAPVRLISSGRAEREPTYSRDGQKITFSSTRSGPLEIWEAAADGSAAVQLTHLGNMSGTPRWSPDGSAIAFTFVLDGNPEIMVVTEEGRRVRRITNNPAEDVVPSWSADGRWIYFASNRKGDFQIYKIRSDQTESPSNLPVQVTMRGGFNAIESPDGKYLYYARRRTRPDGLWRLRLDASPESEQPVLESLQNWGWGWWAVSSSGIFFLEGEKADSKLHLKFLNLRSKQIIDLRTLESGVNDEVAPLAVSLDGRHVLFEQSEAFESKIVMIENFR